MIILPCESIVQLKLDPARAGVLDTTSRESAVEYGEVVAVGEGVKGFAPGDKVFVKSWAIDIIDHEGEKYWFLNVETKGLLARVK